MRQLAQQMTISGNSPHTLTYGEGAGQTFEVGAPVVLNASKQVIEATSPVGTAAGSILGVAAVNASGITGNPVPVWIANDDTLFAGTMVGGVTTDLETPVSVKKTGAVWALDRTAAGNFLVLEIETTQPPAGTVIGRGKFLESSTQVGRVA